LVMVQEKARLVCTSLASIVDRMNTELRSKLFGSPKCDFSYPLPKGWWSRSSSDICVLFLCGAQLRSSILAILHLDEVHVTLKNAEIFRSVLSGEGGLF
jgi:hypothetical protein